MRAKGPVSLTWQTIFVVIPVFAVFLGVILSTMAYTFDTNVAQGLRVFTSLLVFLILFPCLRIRKNKEGVFFLILLWVIPSVLLAFASGWIIGLFVMLGGGDGIYQSEMSMVLYGVIVSTVFSLALSYYVRKWSKEWNNNFQKGFGQNNTESS